MNDILLLYSNKFHSLEPLKSFVVLTPESSIVIKNSINTEISVSIFLINPFNFITNHFFLNKTTEKTISINFNSFMPSGVYYFKFIDYSHDTSLSTFGNNNESTEYLPFQFSGAYNQFSWTITYAISTFVKNGMDIRLAAPKQYFPFVFVESLEGKPVSNITTDAWSNWLIYDSSSKIGINEVLFGYRTVVHSNYIIFSPSAFEKEYQYDKGELIRFLASEPGIESSDEIIRSFAKNVTASSLHGKLIQILYVITNFLTFKDQQGEFGAKYAVLNRQGDCTEFSALFTALCRINEIPSRLVAGLKRIGTTGQANWIRHAWTEIYYEGLWIPIDVVEGKSKLIGFHPDLLPLFKGNWMADNMHRELKISILDEFKDKLSTNDLVESYSRLAISYKVQPVDQTDISNNWSKYDLDRGNIKQFIVPTEQKVDTQIEICLYFNELEKNSILSVYYKAETISNVKSPKIIHFIEKMKEKKMGEYQLNIHTPEFPGNFELGIFISTIYGEILGLSTVKVKIL